MRFSVYAFCVRGAIYYSRTGNDLFIIWTWISMHVCCSLYMCVRTMCVRVIFLLWHYVNNWMQLCDWFVSSSVWWCCRPGWLLLLLLLLLMHCLLRDYYSGVENEEGWGRKKQMNDDVMCIWVLFSTRQLCIHNVSIVYVWMDIVHTDVLASIKCSLGSPTRGCAVWRSLTHTQTTYWTLGTTYWTRSTEQHQL